MGTCIQLKTQVQILGYTGIVICISMLFSYGAELNNLLETEDTTQQHNDNDMCDYNPFRCLTPAHVISFYMIAITLWIIPHVLLILGAVRENHLLLLPWLISMAIFFCVSICGMLMRLVTRMDTYANIWPLELIRIIVISFVMFNWYLVVIYYRQLRIILRLKILKQLKSLKVEDIPYTVLEDEKNQTLVNVD